MRETEFEAFERVFRSVATRAEAEVMLRDFARRWRTEIGEVRALTLYAIERFGETPSTTESLAKCEQAEALCDQVEAELLRGAPAA
jgi:hypothetical protein